MIDDPPVLKIRRNFDRPSPAQLAAFKGIPTGNVVDAMDGSGAMAPSIKPLDPRQAPLVGIAVTCHTGPSDNLGLFAAMDVAQAGDMLIAATNRHLDAAVAGDLMVGMCCNIGVAALITDGAVRDLEGIEKFDLPVYCAGVTPNSPARNGPGTAGLPTSIGGVHVCSGDIVVADRDGVVVVPQAQIDDVIAQLEAILAAESALEADVRAGLTIPDFIKEILASDRTVELD